MDKDFQDKIDDYLFDRMNEQAKRDFEKEISLDEEKKKQFLFTKNLRQSIDSRQDKQKRLNEMEQKYDAEKEKDTQLQEPHCPTLSSYKKKWLWFSSVAAFGLCCYLGINHFISADDSSPIRGGEDVFTPIEDEDVANDTLQVKDSIPNSDNNHEENTSHSDGSDRSYTSDNSANAEQ